MALKQRSDIKVQELCVRLRELAFERGPGAKLPSTRTLCELLNTTPSTLNDALKELEVQNVIYSKLRSGIFVSPKLYRKSICTLFYADLFPAEGGASPFWGIFWSLFAREMQRRSTTRNEYYSFHFVLDHSPDSLDLPEDVVRMIEAGKIHGVLAAGMLISAFEWLNSHHIPSVTYAGLGTCMVGSDVADQTRQAVTELVDQGCRSIGLWRVKGIPINWTSDPYFNSFRSTLSALGRDFSPDLMRIGGSSSTEENAHDYQEQGYQLALQVFGNPATPASHRPDGIFISDDLMTSGVLQAFRELGIQAGKDVKIVSHANYGSPTLFRETRRLSLVEINPSDIVQTMFSLLDLLMAGEVPAERIVNVKSRLRKMQ